MDTTIDKCDEITVFYDQECGLCDHTIRYLIEKDVDEKLTFSPLQGKYARQKLPASLREDLSSYVVLSRDVIMVRGSAIKFLIRNLRTLRVYKWILFIPMFIVNFGYNIIGMYRYKIFGKSKYCVHLDNKLKNRFFD